MDRLPSHQRRLAARVRQLRKACGMKQDDLEDFGLHWNAALETGGFVVGDDVKISLSLQAVPKKA